MPLPLTLQARDGFDRQWPVTFSGTGHEAGRVYRERGMTEYGFSPTEAGEKHGLDEDLIAGCCTLADVRRLFRDLREGA